MRYIRYVFFLLLFCSYSANAIEIIVKGEADDAGHSPIIDVLSVSTGGSGGEDRLTETFTNVLVSTGGSGGEDRLIDLFDKLLVSTGGSGGEDRFTELTDEIVNPLNGSSLSDFLATIVLTEPTSITYLTVYDVLEPMYISKEVVSLFGGYTHYRVESLSVPEPVSVILLLFGLVVLSAIRIKGGRGL